MSANPIARTPAFVLAALILAFAAGSPAALAQSKQLSLADILIALRSKKAEMPEKNKILADAVKARGITFALTPDIERELGSTGAQKNLIDAIKSRLPQVAKAEPVTPPVIAKPAAPPPDFDFYKSRAAAAVQKNDLDAALADLAKAIELKPNAAAAYLDRGLILAKQDKHDLAVIDFDKVVQLDATAAAYVARAVSREKLGNAEIAMADYRRALDLDAKNEAANTAFNRLMAEKVAAEAKRKPDPVKEPSVQTAVPAPAVGSRIVSVGALNAQAIRLVPPQYTPEHRRMGLQGKVMVLIALGENGEILSATATEGPKQLRVAAEDAVKKSRFKPWLSGGKPVQSNGYIQFNFIANQ